MKKICLFLLGILLFIPMVFADMGAPVIKPYKAKVINENGATIWAYPESSDEEENDTLYDTGFKVPYGTLFDVDFENEDNMVMVAFDENGYYASEEWVEGVNDGFVKLEDITAATETLKYTTKEWNSKTEDIIILKDQEIRKGPALGYKGTGVKVKAGEKIKAYAPNRRDRSWFYVDYNGTKGYIDQMNGQLANGREILKMKTYTKTYLWDVKSYNKNTRTDNENNVLKAGKTYDAIVYFLDMESDYLYIEYGDARGLIGYDDVIIKGEKESFTIGADCNLYREIDDHEIIGTAKKGTKFTSKYVLFLEHENDEEQIDILVFYDDGTNKGWIHSGYKEIIKNEVVTGYKVGYKIDITEKVVPKKEETKEEEKPEETKVETPEVVQKEEPKKQENKSLNKVVTYILIACAVLLCAVVTLLLVNKKRG